MSRSLIRLCFLCAAIISIYSCNSTEDEVSDKSRFLSDRELQSTIDLMRAQQEHNNDQIVELMKTKHITVPRLNIILSDIAILMPYVNSEAIIASPDIYNTLDEDQKISLNRLRDSTKKVADNYVNESKTGTAKDYNKTLALLKKHRKDIKMYITDRFEQVGTEVNQNLIPSNKHAKPDIGKKNAK